MSHGIFVASIYFFLIFFILKVFKWFSITIFVTIYGMYLKVIGMSDLFGSSDLEGILNMLFPYFL